MWRVFGSHFVHFNCQDKIKSSLSLVREMYLLVSSLRISRKRSFKCKEDWVLGNVCRGMSLLLGTLNTRFWLRVGFPNTLWDPDFSLKHPVCLCRCIRVKERQGVGERTRKRGRKFGSLLEDVIRRLNDTGYYGHTVTLSRVNLSDNVTKNHKTCS